MVGSDHGQVAGLLQGLLDLIVEDRAAGGQSRLTGVTGLCVLLADLMGFAVGLLR